MSMRVEVERENDGRWIGIGAVAALPGVLVYGTTKEDARGKAKALALKVVADRLANGESVPLLDL